MMESHPEHKAGEVDPKERVDKPPETAAGGVGVGSNGSGLTDSFDLANKGSTDKNIEKTENRVNENMNLLGLVEERLDTDGFDHDQLDERRPDEHTIHEGATVNKPLVRDTKDAKMTYKERQLAVVQDFCTTINPKKYTVSDQFRANGGVITAKKAVDLLTSSKFRSSVAVVDLRSPEVSGDGKLWASKIPDAMSFPLPEKAPAPSSDDYLRNPMSGSLTDERIKKNWDRQVNDPNSIWPNVLEKPVVIFHCTESAQRTPGIANNYYLHVASRQVPQQKVIILEGGFGSYHAEAVHFTPTEGSPNSLPALETRK